VAWVPFIHWDANENVDLVLDRGTGPHRFDDSDVDRMARAVGYWQTLAHWNPTSSPIRSLRDVLAQRNAGSSGTGLRVRQDDTTPQGQTFAVANPLDQDPRPGDVDDADGIAFVHTGGRLMIRGWVGTAAAGMHTAASAGWYDQDTARIATGFHGVYSGVVLGALNIANAALPASIQTFFGLHGRPKAPGNAQVWSGQQGVGVSTIAANWINTGAHRVTATPDGAGTWTVDAEYDIGAGWVPHRSDLAVALDAGPVDANDAAMVACLFMGPGGDHLWAAANFNTTWLPWFEVDMMEPWVPNMASSEFRDLADQLPPGAISNPRAPFGVRYGSPDLMHVPMGSPFAPVELRKLDPVLGYCVEHAERTCLWAPWTNEATPFDAGTSTLSPCIVGSGGSEAIGVSAPLTVAMRVKLDMTTPAAARNLLTVGDIWRGLPTSVLNGIGIYLDAGDQLVLRYYDKNWVDLAVDFPIDRYRGEVLDVAFAWTGSAGAAAGYADDTVRLLVNGRTVAVASTTAFKLAADPPVVYVGSGMRSAGAFDAGFTGLFREAKFWFHALTDDEIRRAFTPTTETLDFNTAQADGEPGAAEGWMVREQVSEPVMAAFRNSPWSTPSEPFDWFDEHPAVQINGPTWDTTVGEQTVALGGGGAVVTAAPVNTIQLVAPGFDVSAALPTGSSLRIQGSTGLDAYWTVASVAGAGPNYTITTDEDILTTTADGTMTIPELWTAAITGVTPDQWAQLWDVFFANPAAATPTEIASVLAGYVQHLDVRARREYVVARGEWGGFARAITITRPATAETWADWGEDDVGWADDLDDVTSAAAVYGDGTPLRDTAEPFRWAEQYGSLEAAGTDDAEFLSWYERVHGVAVPRELPRITDTFDEAWGLDHLDTTRQITPPSHNGRIYSDVLTLPLYVKANRNLIHVIEGTSPGTVRTMVLPEGALTTLAGAAGVLSAAWGVASPASPLTWGYEDRGDGTFRFWFGWDGAAALAPAEEVYLASGVGVFADRDARADLGLLGLSPSGAAVKVDVPAGYLAGTVPAAWDLDQQYGADPWSYLSVSTATDPDSGLEYPLAHGKVPASFDTATRPSEPFLPDGWGGAWLNPAIYAWTNDCLFDTGLGPGELYEDFEEGW